MSDTNELWTETASEARERREQKDQIVRPMGVPETASIQLGTGVPSVAPANGLGVGDSQLTAPNPAPAVVDFSEVLNRARHQPSSDLTAEPFGLTDFSLEELVPRLMARVERLEREVSNLESVVEMAVTVITNAVENSSHICSTCSARLDAIAEGRAA